MPNQPRGILTESDRKHLRLSSEERREEFSQPSISEADKRIIKRTRNGLFDLTTLYRKLSTEQRRKIFRGFDEMTWPGTLADLSADASALLILGTLEQANRDLDDSEFYETLFSEIISRTLQKHSGGFGPGSANIDVDVTIDDWAPYDHIHEHEELEDLRPEMLRSLLRAGEISDQEFAEAVLNREE